MAPSAMRIDALTAFMLVQNPNVEAVRIPSALLDDAEASVASAARMASGALARAGRAAHPDQAATIDAAHKLAGATRVVTGPTLE